MHLMDLRHYEIPVIINVFCASLAKSSENSDVMEQFKISFQGKVSSF